MIDIHTHIIPYLDDGAEDITDALLMAELAVESGVHTMIATPHSNLPRGIDYSKAEYRRCFDELAAAIKKKQIPLRILQGMEIYAAGNVVEKIQKKELLSLNDSGHYLIEFDFYSRSRMITGMLEDLRDIDVVPVIAHPERYVCVQNRPEVVIDWLDMGCQLQMNKGSIFGNFGRDSYYTAETLLFERSITYIASDAHTPYQRTTHMENIWQLLCEEFSPDYARELLIENPQKYLIDKR